MVMQKLGIEFTPSGAQLEAFVDSHTERRFLMGPLGSGKTFTCAFEALRRCCEQAPGADGVRRSTGLVTRTKSTELESSALKDWLDLTEGKFRGALGKFSWASPRHHELIFRLPDQTRVEATIWFIGLDEPDGERQVRGMPLTWAWANEAKDFSFALITMIFGRTGRFPRMEDGGPSWSGLFGDTNMPFIGHWLHRLAEEEQPPGWQFFRQPGGVVKRAGRWVENALAENLDFLPPNYYQKQLAGAEDSWINVYLAANYGFTLDGTPVYPDYSDALHCHQVAPIRSVPIYRGWDFGLTPACVFSQLQPHGRWVIFDEICTDTVGLAADDFSDEVLAYCGREYEGYHFEDDGDPSGEDRGQTDEKTCFQILRKKGIAIRSPFRALSSVKRAKDNLTLRLESVKRALRTNTGGKPLLALSPKCIMLRRGFMGGYRYRQMHTLITRFVDKPEKNEYSHPMNALEYTAARLFGGLLVEKDARPRTPEAPRARSAIEPRVAWMA